MSAPEHILKKVRFIELKLRRRVKDLFAGGYQSTFKGQGMIFSDYRKYVPGDDVRSISWPLTAKKGVPYIKLFEEERGATFIVMVDISASLDFGSKGFKGEAACELASLITLSAQKNQDSASLLLFSDRVEHYVPPGRDNRHALRLIRDMYSFKRKSVQSDMVSSLSFLNNVLKKRCHIFLFSDFFMSSDFTKALQLIGKKHDVVAVVVNDPFEMQLAPIGLMDIEDPETGKRITVDSASPAFLKHYKQQVKYRKEMIKSSLTRSNVDVCYLQTDQDIFKQFFSFINRRSGV